MVMLSRLRKCLCIIRHVSTNSNKSPEPRFSESAAFQGRKRGAGVAKPAYEMDYYTSDEFGRKKLLSVLGSLAVFIFYFGYWREPSDLDEIWAIPPHILTAGVERKMLRDQIKYAEAKGQDTSLLKAQLEYVDVKEAALQIQFQTTGQEK
ncbi:hypothetical protein DICVIV_08513 [Dictyocaulus viviparus]|uniref:Uncharacterized protein n=1 Tax=Dictyocaulus viviparus TaxID=29172 RepID=A0A0D8XNQ7_DICVI|nr:hypothetical protein DICVIV_08513 [Dictyocaulus viviparus]